LFKLREFAQDRTALLAIQGNTSIWLKSMVRARGLEPISSLRDFSFNRILLGNAERFFISRKIALCNLLRPHEVFLSSIVIKKGVGS
jgi:hypothetical protein